MWRQLSLFLLIWTTIHSLTTVADEMPFCAHITLPARALEPGKFALRPGPGEDVSDAQLLSENVVVGVLPRLEVGTVPYEWTRSFHKINAMAKVEFFRTDSIHAGLGMSYDRVNLEQVNFGFTFIRTAWLMSWHPLGTRWNYSLNIGSYIADVTVQDLSKWVLKPSPDEFLDVTYQLMDRLYLTGGLSYSHLESLSEPTLRDYMGVGPSLAYEFRNQPISLVSVGAHYYPALGLTKFLWTLAL